MVPFWLILIVLFFLFLFWHFDKKRNYWHKKGIPGPRAWLLFGHYWKLRMANKRTILQIQQWTKEFGQFYGLYDGPRRILVISDLRMVHELLITKFDIFEARKLNTMASTLSSYNACSILHATSFRWKRLRNIEGTFFNGINVKKTLPTMLKVTEKYIGFLKSAVGAESINIQSFLQEFSDDILVGLILGDAHSSEQPYFVNMCNAIEAKKRTSAKLFSMLSTIIPSSKWAIDWLNSLMATNHHYNIRLFDNFAQMVETAKRRRANLDANNASGIFTFVDHLLTANFEEISDDDNGFGSIGGGGGRNTTRYLMRDEIVSACINFLYAGHKTLARALTSVIYCLANDAEVQKKLFDEEISNLPNGEELTFEAIERMSFLDSVIREALRLFPLGSEHVARKCMAPTSLGDRIKLEPGDFVMVDVMSIHLDATFWGENPEKFNPSRWLNLEFRNADKYFSFGQGPRMCIGEKLALLQLKVVIIKLLNSFKIIAKEQSDAQKDDLLSAQFMAQLIQRDS